MSKEKEHIYYNDNLIESLSKPYERKWRNMYLSSHIVFSYFLNTFLSLVIILSCQKDGEEESKAGQEGVVSCSDLLEPKIRVNEFGIQS